MCQPKSKGGRRCPAHMAATRNAKALAGQLSGLENSQLTTTFNELREEGRDRPAPTVQQYAQYLQRQIDYIERAPMDSKNRARARKLIETAASENLPDGPTFYALKKLNARTRSQSRALRREISALAPQMGMTRAQAMRQFWNAYHNSASTTSAPAGYESGNISAAAHGLPRDEATNRAYASLRRAASSPEANPNISTQRRVELRPVESSFISQIGYDPEDGRLEVVFARTPDQIYAYRNVPASVWEEMNRSGASVGSIYSRQVRRNSDHAYGSHDEADADAYRRRCGYCGQFRAAAHVCPESQGEISEPRVAEPIISTPEPAPEPELTVAEDTHLPSREEALETPVSIHALDSETESEEVALADEESEEAEPTAASHVEEPVAEEPVAEEPVAEEPVAEEPVAEEPVAEEPVAEEPVAEEPVAEEPVAEGGTTGQEAATPTARRTRRSAQPRMTAAQRRMMLPHEERAVVNLEGIASRQTYFQTAEVNALGEESGFRSGDSVSISSPSRVRSTVNRGDVAVVSLAWSGRRTDLDSESSYYGRFFHLSGTAHLYRDAEGWKAHFPREPRCQCPQYRQNSRCVHVDQAKANFARVAHLISDRTGFNAANALATAEEGEVPSINVAASNRRRRASTFVNPDAPDATGFPHDGQDRVTAPSAPDIRSALAVGNAVVPVSWNGWRGNVPTEQQGSFYVSGDVTLSRDNDQNVTVTSRNLRCACYQYRRNYHCVHVDYVANQASRLSTAGTRSAARVGVTHEDVEAARQRDWTQNEELRQAMEARRAPARPEDMYSSNFSAFKEDYDAALTRKAQGESPVPFLRENATDGLLSPESGRRFGVELEFDLPDTVDKYTALRKIGQELHEAGLTASPSQLNYGSARHAGYSQWSFESDCTVDGELVSPIMSDRPEDWAQLEKACEIIRRNGGKATTRAGSHVHVSSGSYGQDVKKHAELLRMTQQHEDTIYRLATNPERGRHRPMRWCAPNSSFNSNTEERVQSDIQYYTRYGEDTASIGRIIRGMSNGHNYGINYQSAAQGNPSRDNIEFRQWDASLDPAVIQTQVKISAAMVAAAERNVDQHGPSSFTREPVGSRYIRERGMLNGSRRRLTAEELEETTTTARTFIDMLFTRREDKAQAASLLAVTKWQRGSL